MKGYSSPPSTALDPNNKKSGQLGCLIIILIGLISLFFFPSKHHELSQFDADYTAVHWLKANYLRDPDSYEEIRSEFNGSETAGYTLRLWFRAKNGVGGYEQGHAVFQFDGNGKLTSALPSG